MPRANGVYACAATQALPNTIAYSHGVLEARDLAVSGLIVGAVALVLVIVGGPPIIQFWLG